MKAVEFMTTNIRYIDSDYTVYDAIEQMVDRRIRSLVVRFPKKEMDYGVITARDIVIKVLSKEKDPAAVRVAEIASTPMLCVDQETTLNEAASLMEENGVGRIFICENGKLIGVVALIDLMSAALIQRARGE